MEKFWRALLLLICIKVQVTLMQEVGGVPGRLTLSHMEKPWHHQSWVDVKQEVKKKKKEKKEK